MGKVFFTSGVPAGWCCCVSLCRCCTVYRVGRTV